ncbi:MAG: hypothetical protein QXN35_00975 [Ignisphaera sp.]
MDSDFIKCISKVCVERKLISIGDRFAVTIRKKDSVPHAMYLVAIFVDRYSPPVVVLTRRCVRIGGSYGFILPPVPKTITRILSILRTKLHKVTVCYTLLSL